MFHANFYVGSVAAVITPVYFLLSWRQASLLKGVRRGPACVRERRTNGLFNIIESIIVIKSFVREEYEREKQARFQRELIEAQMKQRQTNYVFDSLKTFTEQVGVVLIIILTAYLVLNVQMTIGAIMFHVLLFNNVSAPIRQLHRIYDEINEVLTYADGFFEILDADASIEESGPLPADSLKGDFELQKCRFRLPERDAGALRRQHDDPGGAKCRIRRAFGSGEIDTSQSIVQVLSSDSRRDISGREEPARIRYSSLRQKIGLVLQRNHIFRGSIEENIRYGNIDATFEDVVEASKKAYLHGQIEMLPHKYETDAQSLSGGQQQRIAIARLFLKDPRVIFLDEPTASLDAIATEQIKNSLDAIKENRTTVIISHSISQIIDSEIIYVLKEGRMVESGKHEELTEKAEPTRRYLTLRRRA